MTLPVEPVYTLENGTSLHPGEKKKKSNYLDSIYLFHIHIILSQGAQTNMSACLYCMESKKCRFEMCTLL